MSAIQELQPYCDAFQGRIREAKDSKGYTLQRLIDESGVPKSAVNNINAGKRYGHGLQARKDVDG